MLISSTSNTRVKWIRRLRDDARFRRREGMFVVEGERWLGDVRAAAVVPDLILHTVAWDNHPLLTGFHTTTLPVSDAVMSHLSDVQTPPGVLAVVPIPNRPIPSTATLLLILDGIRTPGNMGTLLRTAAAAGVDGVLLGPGCVDPFAPKVVRGGMGAQLRVPLRRAAWPEITAACDGFTVWAAAAGGSTRYVDADWTAPSALIVGNEAHGVGELAAALAYDTVSIPMAGATESLNAAMAGGIILFEAARQRGFGR